MPDCPICAAPMISSPRLSLPLMRCACGFITMDLQAWDYPYANQDYYSNHAPDLSSSIKPFISHRVEQIKRRLKSGTVADLGCGLGETVIALSEAGYNAIGVEESPTAVNLLRESYPQVHWENRTIREYLQQCNPHDGITLYHVLEHIPNPKRVCALLKENIRPGGLLVIEVPDVGGGRAKLSPRKWGYYLPHHVNYFTVDTLAALVEPLGFGLTGFERKYHFGWPQGVWWKDGIHRAFAFLRVNSVVSSYWERR